MCRLKVRRRIGRYFAGVARCDTAGIFYWPDVGVVGRCLKRIEGHDLQLHRITPWTEPPIYVLFTKDKRPRLIDEWGDWMVFEV